jgi:hypothetical protein
MKIRIQDVYDQDQSTQFQKFKKKKRRIDDDTENMHKSLKER